MIIIPRLARKELNTPFLHVMVQGVNKEYIFERKEYIETYLRLIKKYTEKYVITIIAYCIMSNHVHLLMYAEEVEELAKFMHKVNLIYSQYYNKEENRCGVIFRNRYKIEAIRDLRHLVNCINYIHMNPVKADMVNKCEDYPYSSYKEYINNGEITKSKIMIDTFGKDFDYNKIFNNSLKYLFIDIEEPSSDDISEVIDSAINVFLRLNNTKLEDVLSNEKDFIRLLYYLKNEYKLEYIQILKKFDVSKSTALRLRKKYNM